MDAGAPNNASMLSHMNEQFVSYILLLVVFTTLIVVIGYIMYIRRLQKSQCDYMNDLYSDLDGNLRSIDANDPDCSGNLFDYYIKTSYNSCSGGSYKNNYVDICNVKSILKQGVRCLDFELYSIDNTPVVATSTADNYYVKETFNSVDFADVMNTISNYAFASGTAPNYNDPILIHLRIMSTNQDMYTNLANIFADNSNIMLGKEYSYENSNTNIGNVPITELMGKCVLIVDKINNAFIQNEAFMEYVNLASNSVFMRTYNYSDIQNNPDVTELTNFNRRGMTIVFPNNDPDPANPSGILCREYGCQMVAMRYQYVDNNLEQNAMFFDKSTYAFSLKPARLRYSPVMIADPEPQKPEYSYSTRNVSTDFYNFDF
jgi:hypothetical protein